MINIKDWEKYSAMVKIYNQQQWIHVNEINRKMREEHFARQNERKEKANLEALKSGFPPFFMPTMCGYCMPLIRQATVEDCLDWIVAGRKVFAKKLIPTPVSTQPATIPSCTSLTKSPKRSTG